MSIITARVDKEPSFSCIETNKLSLSYLQDLFSGKIQALQVKNYYPKEIAQLISEKILAQKSGYYINAPSIGRIGMAYFEASGDPALIKKYYREATNNINHIRSFFEPYYSPLDKFRLELQEEWMTGCNIENIDNKKMFVGLLRVVDEQVDFLPHQDIFSRDVRDNKKIANSLLCQVAVNIYLQMAPQGGELEMWNTLMSTEEYDRIRRGNYGLPRESVGDAHLAIRPEPGDLILFNANKFHAVRPSIGNKRISISCFVGYRGSNLPLTVWS